jgi:hypothetical protein
LVIFANIKLNEPFYQLSQPGGADPTTGLFFEFLATGFPVDHFKAGLAGNYTSWYMMISYAALMLLLVVPSLAAEAFGVQYVKGGCESYDTSDLDCADLAWTVSTRGVRALEFVLVLLAAAVLTVIVMQLRRKRTLSLRTTNLETIGDILEDPEILALLRRVSPESTPAETHTILTQYRYRLESATSHGVEKDILRCSPEEHQAEDHTPKASTALKVLEYLVAPFARIQSALDLIIPGFLILLLMTIVMYFVSVPAEKSKLTFLMKNTTFGAKFVLVILTTLLGIAFCRIEYEVRVLTIYRSLYTASDPQTVLSRSLHGSPFAQTWSAIKHGEWVGALVSGMAGFGIAALSIAISNVPWHSGESIQNTSTCILITMILLALMASSLVAVAMWRRSVPRGIPRIPATLADIAVLMVHDRVPGVVLGRKDKEDMLKITETVGP